MESRTDEDRIVVFAYQSKGQRRRMWAIRFEPDDPSRQYELLGQNSHGLYPTLKDARLEADRLDDIPILTLKMLRDQFEEGMDYFLEHVQRSWNGEVEDKNDLLNAIAEIRREWLLYDKELESFRERLETEEVSEDND